MSQYSFVSLPSCTRLTCLELRVIICTFLLIFTCDAFTHRTSYHWGIVLREFIYIPPPVSITVFIYSLECFYDNTPAAKVRWYPTEAAH